MANYFWSEQVQTALTLDLSREARFRDDRKQLFLDLLDLHKGMTVLDIGCGPGTLTRKLALWLGQESKIIGLDQDTNFLNYAREKAEKLGLLNLSYIEGNALALPLADSSVDACLSYTVIEHLPNKEFLIEQQRVCKPGGRVSVITVLPDKCLKTNSHLAPKPTEKEQKLLKRLFSEQDAISTKNNVGQYAIDPVDFPLLFGELGFEDIWVDAFAVPIAIDDDRNTLAEKIALIKNEELQFLEIISKNARLYKKLSEAELDELKKLIHAKTEERIALIREGAKVWDYSISFSQIVSGKVMS